MQHMMHMVKKISDAHSNMAESSRQVPARTSSRSTYAAALSLLQAVVGHNKNGMRNSSVKV
jgi:hypothetical protein